MCSGLLTRCLRRDLAVGVAQKRRERVRKIHWTMSSATGITREKLAQQYIGSDIKEVGLQHYESWLWSRAEALAAAANSFLTELRSTAGIRGSD